MYWNVLGKGGREHAVSWALAQTAGSNVLCLPGNPGIAGEPGVGCSSIDLANHSALIKVALSRPGSITIVGSEDQLAAGIVDDFNIAGAKIVGPTREAAQLEVDKVFAADFLRAASVPTPGSTEFDSFEMAVRFVSDPGLEYPIVIKAKGPCAGKGVVVAKTRKQAIDTLEDFMVRLIHGKAGEEVAIQTYIVGPECSIMGFVDGEDILFTIPSQDHKTLYVADQGPNTGGMGAYAPFSYIDREMEEFIHEHMFKRTLREAQKRGIPLKGILYAGLRITKDGPRLQEWNFRMADPETQPSLMLLDTPLTEIFDALVSGDLRKIGKLRWKSGAACTIILVTKGYAEPDSQDMPEGGEITGLDQYGQLAKPIGSPGNEHVFHGATERRSGGRFFAKKGRILGVTYRHVDVAHALNDAYMSIGENGVHFPNMYFRSDIGRFALQN